MSNKNAAWIELLLAMINNAGPVSAAIRQAQAEGRALSREELQAAFDQDDDARGRLTRAIEAAD
jgi:hypothetical protein